MRAARSTFSSLALLAAALVFAGCNGGDASNGANAGTNSAPADNTTKATDNNAAGGNSANNAVDTNSANNAAGNEAANNAASTDEHAGHNHAPGEHGKTGAASAGPKVGIQTTKPGTGPGAKDGDLLSMRYTGRLTNGKVFDSNVTKDPFNLVLGAGSVIRGWEEGLQGVKIGERRTLKIPAAKGYGEAGAGADIPPNSDLVFEIECLYIVPADKQDVVKRETIRAGSGPVIKDKQTVSFHFRGLLLGGKEFDSSYAAKKPISVKIGSESLQPVGLESGMVGMRVGGKYRLTFPPLVAFGPGGNNNGTVPGNSVVIFEIEPLSAK